MTNFTEYASTNRYTDYRVHGFDAENYSDTLSDDVRQMAFETLVDVVNEGADTVVAVAHTSDRKGFVQFYPIGENRGAYQRDDDDVTIQVTVRVPRYQVTEFVERAEQDRQEEEARRAEQKEAERQAEIEALEERLAQLRNA